MKLKVLFPFVVLFMACHKIHRRSHEMQTGPYNAIVFVYWKIPDVSRIGVGLHEHSWTKIIKNTPTVKSTHLKHIQLLSSRSPLASLFNWYWYCTVGIRRKSKLRPIDDSISVYFLFLRSILPTDTNAFRIYIQWSTPKRV